MTNQPGYAHLVAARYDRRLAKQRCFDDPARRVPDDSTAVAHGIQIQGLAKRRMHRHPGRVGSLVFVDRVIQVLISRVGIHPSEHRSMVWGNWSRPYQVPEGRSAGPHLRASPDDGLPTRWAHQRQWTGGLYFPTRHFRPGRDRVAGQRTDIEDPGGWLAKLDDPGP